MIVCIIKVQWSRSLSTYIYISRRLKSSAMSINTYVDTKALCWCFKYKMCEFTQLYGKITYKALLRNVEAWKLKRHNTFLSKSPDKAATTTTIPKLAAWSQKSSRPENCVKTELAWKNFLIWRKFWELTTLNKFTIMM